MKVTKARPARRHPVLLLRDARGRFARVRVPVMKKRRPRGRVLRLLAPVAVQLVLF